MVGLREKVGKYATPSHTHRAYVPDLGHFVDSTGSGSIIGRHGLMGEIKNSRNLLRQRFTQTLNRKQSFPARQTMQSTESSVACTKGQEQQPSLIRKSISSLSSSLRDRFSLDASADEENRPSVIRKSFGSMSNSLRGVRSSLDSRPSQDEENDVERLPYCHFSRSVGYAGGNSDRPSCRRFGQPSGVPSGSNSIPRLPDVDELISKIANARGEKGYSDGRSPTSLFSMSIFDSLDRPITAEPRDIGTTMHTESVSDQPPPITGRLPIRLKCPNPTLAKRIARSKAEQDALANDDSGHSTGPDETKIDDAPRAHETSKVPVFWLDSILEMTVDTREGVRKARIPTETDEERYLRLSKKVFVFVPDENDHTKPWPKKTYPDLKTALVAICTRFKPFYAPFAAYTMLTRTVQLFPADFKLPRNCSLIPGSIMFTMQEALDNWDSTLFSRSLSVVEEETEDQGTIELSFDTVAVSGSERTREISTPSSYISSGDESEETNDYSMLEPSPESSLIAETNPLRYSDQAMEDSHVLSWLGMNIVSRVRSVA
ncbi:hypothetical protein F5B19DRAFT_488529 [Rostrohypoxylon terebratum]|nr:hypothetical protein F5B19DRAFT_488529 [Rostrohypoxylon terebratum]